MVKKMQKMKIWPNIFNCLYCNKINSNVVFCSYECKNRHYDNALAHLKSKCDESTCFECKAFERRIEK